MRQFKIIGVTSGKVYYRCKAGDRIDALEQWTRIRLLCGIKAGEPIDIQEN